MTKQDIVNNLAEKHGITRSTADSIINELAGFIHQDLLETGYAVIHGVGRLKVVKRAQRTGRNPKDGSQIVIPETFTLKYTITKDLKEALNA